MNGKKVTGILLLLTGAAWVVASKLINKDDSESVANSNVPDTSPWAADRNNYLARLRNGEGKKYHLLDNYTDVYDRLTGQYDVNLTSDLVFFAIETVKDEVKGVYITDAQGRQLWVFIPLTKVVEEYLYKPGMQNNPDPKAADKVTTTTTNVTTYGSGGSTVTVSNPNEGGALTLKGFINFLN